MSIPQSIKGWARNYFIRLNSGNRPMHRPPDFIQERSEARKRPIINIALFIITFLSTTFAGASEGKTLYATFVSGLPYSVTLIVILLVHEFGHYCAARKFGVDATLPYFIPFPSHIGTMGAVIKTRSPIPSRRALFYIGAMGPLPGFIVSFVAVTAGIYISDIKPILHGVDVIDASVFGNSILTLIIKWVIHGPIPPGQFVDYSPYAFAGWIGFLITSLNLMPIGQLDGGHILHALVGRKQVLFGWCSLAGLVVLSLFWPGWILWIALTLLILMVAHPEISDGEELSSVEKMMGWFCMIILIVTFVPIPVDFL